MPGIADLKEMEKTLWRSYFNDGLWDVYGGFTLFSLGLYILTDRIWLMILGIVIALSVLMARKRIITERLGKVTFSKTRHVKEKKAAAMAILSGTAILGVVMMVLFTLNSIPGWLHDWIVDYFMLFFGGMISLVVIAAAMLVSVGRYYAYAVLIFLSFAGHQWLDMPLEYTFIIPASLFLGIGSGIYIRFIKGNPKITEDWKNGGS